MQRDGGKSTVAALAICLVLGVMAAARAGADLSVLPGATIDISIDDIHTANFGPQSAFDAAGNYVVTWTRWRDDGTKGGVVARLYDAQGNPRTAVFQVNTHQADFQQNPIVAMNAAGEFVIAWQSYDQDGPGEEVYFQHYRADGSRVRGETEASVHFVNGDVNPSMGIDDAGEVVIAWWNTDGVLVRRFSRTSRPLSGPVLVASSDNASSPALAMHPDGTFTLVWRTYVGSQGASLWVQRFGVAANPIGSAIKVNTAPIPSEGIPMVAATPGEGFVVVWEICDFQHFELGCPVKMRTFSAAARPLLPETQLSTNDFRTNEQTAVAADLHGNVAVVWDSCLATGNGQLYDCKVMARFIAPGATPSAGFPTWTLSSDDDLLDPAVAGVGGGFLVGFDALNCDVVRCDGKTPTGAYAVRFTLQP